MNPELINALGNADGHSRTGNVLGMASGLVTTGLGMSLLFKPNIDSRIGEAAVAMGTMSMALSTRSMYRRSSFVSEREKDRRTVADAGVTPTVDIRGNAGARMLVSVNF